MVAGTGHVRRNYAAGVRVHSKYGGGMCWAYWTRRRDDGLGTDPVQVLDETEIQRNDGRADIAVQLMSEHRCVPGARIIGPLPDEVQQITEFSWKSTARTGS